MAVQSLQTVENAMSVLEAVAQHQPIGVSALARQLDMDATVRASPLTLSMTA